MKLWKQKTTVLFYPKKHKPSDIETHFTIRKKIKPTHWNEEQRKHQNKDKRRGTTYEEEESQSWCFSFGGRPMVGKNICFLSQSLSPKFDFFVFSKNLLKLTKLHFLSLSTSTQTDFRCETIRKFQSIKAKTGSTAPVRGSYGRTAGFRFLTYFS